MAAERPARDDAEETRRAILRAAQPLFMEHGYRAVSTRQIAEACGLTQPALYHHFNDKEQLYVAVLLDELGTMRAGLERIAGRGGDVAERLRQVVLFLPPARRDMHQMFRDIEHELHPEASRSLHEAFQASMVAPIAAIFADGMRRGVLRDQGASGLDAAAAASLLLSILARPVAPEDEPAGEGQRAAHRAAILVDFILHGLAAPAQPPAASAPEGSARDDD